MGLTTYHLAELLDLKRADAIPGWRIIEIGAHQLSNFFLRADAELNELYRLCGAARVTLGTAADMAAPDGLETMLGSSPLSERFWASLGFRYTAFEYGGRHGVTAFDLNSDVLPIEMRGSFDLVVNAGTTEHVFDQDHVFRVIHDLTVPGGIMMHSGPSSGWIMHSLYQYGPKFFWNLSEANDYEILRLQLLPWRSRPIPPEVWKSNATWGSPRYPALPQELLEIGYMAVFRKRGAREFQRPLDV